MAVISHPYGFDWGQAAKEKKFSSGVKVGSPMAYGRNAKDGSRFVLTQVKPEVTPLLVEHDGHVFRLGATRCGSARAPSHGVRLEDCALAQEVIRATGNLKDISG